MELTVIFSNCIPCKRCRRQRSLRLSKRRHNPQLNTLMGRILQQCLPLELNDNIYNLHSRTSIRNEQAALNR